MEWSFLRNFAITLFALLNPAGMLPFFINYTARESRVVQSLIGDTGLSIAQRILGLFVAAIGVQFMVTGLSNIIVNNIAPEVLKLK